MFEGFEALTNIGFFDFDGLEPNNGAVRQIW
jgi:hypothetical protein